MLKEIFAQVFTDVLWYQTMCVTQVVLWKNKTKIISKYCIHAYRTSNKTLKEYYKNTCNAIVFLIGHCYSTLVFGPIPDFWPPLPSVASASCLTLTNVLDFTPPPTDILLFLSVDSVLWTWEKYTYYLKKHFKPCKCSTVYFRHIQICKYLFLAFVCIRILYRNETNMLYICDPACDNPASRFFVIHCWLHKIILKGHFVKI